MTAPSYYKIHKSKLTEDQIERYKSGKVEDKLIVFESACNSGYHPHGYGMFDYEIYEYDGTLYAIWKSYKHCD